MLPLAVTKSRKMTSSSKPLRRTPWATFKYLALSPAFIALAIVLGLALGAGVFSTMALNNLKDKQTPAPAPVTKTATVTPSEALTTDSPSPSETVASAPEPSQPPPPAPAPVPAPTRTVIQRAPAPAPAPVNRRASTTLTGSCNGMLTINASGANASISVGDRTGGSSLTIPWEGSFSATLSADGAVSGNWNCGG